MTTTAPDREHDPEPERLRGSILPGRQRPPGGAPHHRVDVAVVPHVDRARRAGSDRDAQHGDGGQHRMQMTRREKQPDKAGENDKRHDPRLQIAT